MQNDTRSGSECPWCSFPKRQRAFLVIVAASVIIHLFLYGSIVLNRDNKLNWKSDPIVEPISIPNIPVGEDKPAA
jgi:hypothetical protein